MQRINYKIFVENINLLKCFKRPLCKFNEISHERNKINNHVNNYVPLTTSTVKVQAAPTALIFNREYSNLPPNSAIDSITFEKVCEETLESLSDYLEELVENASHLELADVQYNSGVLTINFGNPYGTYVINRQSPNHQIWLSSPLSGPKRYDFVPEENYWVYKHDNVPLHRLLQQEIEKIIKEDIDFSKCAYSQL